MLAGPKDGHVWPSEAGAPAAASRGEAERQSAFHRFVCGEETREILCRLAQKQPARPASPSGNSDWKPYCSAFGYPYADETYRPRSFPTDACSAGLNRRRRQGSPTCKQTGIVRRASRTGRSTAGNLLMRTTLLVFIRLYQFLLSPWVGNSCRFYPTCSEYARDAIGKHGAGRGAWLATRRIFRCHPWHPGGADPVP